MVEARFLYHKAMRVLAIAITEVIQKVNYPYGTQLGKRPNNNLISFLSEESDFESFASFESWFQRIAALIKI